MELHEALAQVSEIRLQISRSTTFRGYRAATVAFSGVVAIVAALVQPWMVPSPTADPVGYLTLWIVAAAVSVVAAAIEMSVRAYRSGSPTATRMTWLAVEQFLPCTIAGSLLTFVIARFVPGNLWMLPGMWGIVFSLGVFASCRLLPRPVFWVALYYLACGAACLAWSQEEWAFSPWAMAGTFGGGQSLAAVILYMKLERHHGQS